MDPIPQILSELRAGRMVVLVDDEQRENEGDLVCAGSMVTPAAINFMLHQGRGMLCVALAAPICRRLDLGPQATVNTSQRSTAYTVSVDAHERFGISTGVSAADRAATVRVLLDATSTPADLARPGHMQPLRAREGGVLVRAGQTEGSVDLCRMAGLAPAAAIIEIMNEDGTMARRPQLEAFCARHQIKMCSVADVIHYRLQREKLVQRLETMAFESEMGPFTLMAYQSRVDPLPHVALVRGPLGLCDAQGQSIAHDQPTLVRMHSQNLLGDVLADVHQPTGRTLRRALAMIQREGVGALIYLRHEGMGTGMLKRLQTLHRSETDPGCELLTLGRSQLTPGMEPPTDKLDYGIGSQILRDLGLSRLRLITNHPFHPKALEGFGLEIVEFVPVSAAPDPA